jgi:hypothetical protein
MPTSSNAYADLTVRLGELRTNLLHFLPAPPISRTSYSPQELDWTRSYVLLAHAEIEEFLESLATTRAQTAKDTFDHSGRVNVALRKMLAYYVGKERKSWSHVTRPSADIVRSAWQSHVAAIQSNNGVKRQNLEKLFYPVGIVEPQLDPTWLAAMDSFGGSRGEWAHRSIKVLNVPDPVTETTAVENLLPGLKSLADKASRTR